MEVNRQVEVVEGNDSFQVEVRSGGKLIGFANFFRTVVNGIAAWGARIDVKEKHKGKGVATAALRAGDNHIRSNDPNGLRVFEDINDLSYRGYLDNIREEDIVDVSQKGKIVFKP